MKILKQISELNTRTVLAIGTFDGLHLGHWDVINTAVAEAQKSGLPSAVLTFANHPLSYINPQLQPKELLTSSEKYRLLAAAGVDLLVEVPFDRTLAEITATDFVALVSRHRIVVGEDFHFGKNKQGEARCFHNSIIRPLLTLEGEVISSTRIRGAVETGDLALAGRLLGRPYAITGVVQHGDERGRLLGYPTANIDLGNLVVPPFGVYGVSVTIGHWQASLDQPDILGDSPLDCLLPQCGSQKGCMGWKHNGMANIGRNPTFGVTTPRLEVHLFDFQGDLYGQEISVVLGPKIRDQKHFSNVEDLKAQLAQDKINACTSWH